MHLPTPQTTLILFQTNCIPFYPHNFPNFPNPTQKKALKIDSREEIIPEGTLKNKRK